MFLKIQKDQKFQKSQKFQKKSKKLDSPKNIYYKL